MKNCDEMVNNLFERREQYVAEQKRKRKNIEKQDIFASLFVDLQHYRRLWLGA